MVRKMPVEILESDLEKELKRRELLQHALTIIGCVLLGGTVIIGCVLLGGTAIYSMGFASTIIAIVTCLISLSVMVIAMAIVESWAIYYDYLSYRINKMEAEQNKVKIKRRTAR